MELRFPVGLTYALSLASMWTRLSPAPTKVATRATQGLTSRGSRGRRGGAAAGGAGEDAAEAQRQEEGRGARRRVLGWLVLRRYGRGQRRRI
jgi:hypothetical protein